MAIEVEEQGAWVDWLHKPRRSGHMAENQPRAPKGSPTGGQWIDDDTPEEQPPIKPWREPPAPQGNRKGGSGGYAADGRTNTEVGDAAEAALVKLGFTNEHPGQRHGKFDVRYGNRVFEVKARTTYAEGYKIGMKKHELREKQRYAKKLDLTPGVVMPIIDVDKRTMSVYWRDGLGNFRLTEEWNYAGTVRL